MNKEKEIHFELNQNDQKKPMFNYQVARSYKFHNKLSFIQKVRNKFRTKQRGRTIGKIMKHIFQFINIIIE